MKVPFRPRRQASAAAAAAFAATVAPSFTARLANGQSSPTRGAASRSCLEHDRHARPPARCTREAEVEPWLRRPHSTATPGPRPASIVVPVTDEHQLGQGLQVQASAAATRPQLLLPSQSQSLIPRPRLLTYTHPPMPCSCHCSSQSTCLPAGRCADLPCFALRRRAVPCTIMPPLTMLVASSAQRQRAAENPKPNPRARESGQGKGRAGQGEARRGEARQRQCTGKTGPKAAQYCLRAGEPLPRFRLRELLLLPRLVEQCFRRVQRSAVQLGDTGAARPAAAAEAEAAVERVGRGAALVPAPTAARSASRRDLVPFSLSSWAAGRPRWTSTWNAAVRLEPLTSCASPVSSVPGRYRLACRRLVLL
ncbi:uncharacterized protein PSFLO_02450 [Pseudozyma flocculosa]|uniref:Uncharacterized protein n=1 Tax=Pseudozyma flocculosa TaxID=84751 RepID=A0A5C3EXN3_9BASI|nr:uncharacterized protein PSFLO_02450 [Pseudozyma flocculosa]